MVDGVASSRWVCWAAAGTPRTTLAMAAAGTNILRMALLEQIVERLLGARLAVGRRRGFGFALDGRTRLEEGAHVTRVLGRDASRNRPVAFKGGAAIEVHALGAAVKIGRTLGTLACRAPGGRHGEFDAAPHALHDLAEAGHVEGLRRDRRLPARRVFLLLLFRLVLARLARLVLVA